MDAPKRYCCGERHWPIEAFCPNRKPARTKAKAPAKPKAAQRARRKPLKRKA